MITQKDISYLSFGLKPVPVVPLETVERLKQEVKQIFKVFKKRNSIIETGISKGELKILQEEILEVFGVEAKK